MKTFENLMLNRENGIVFLYTPVLIIEIRSTAK